MMKNSAKIEFLEHKLIEFLEHKLDEDIHPTRATYLHDGRYSMRQLDLECSC